MNNNSYWSENIRLMLALMLVWFLVSFGCGILWVDYLDQFKFFGYKLGFWFSQQGSIYVFIILIFVYAWRMNKIDEKYEVHEIDESGDQK
jgi:putative solute:sodium symporter small subunit